MYDFTDYIKNKKALVQKMTSVKNKISELKEFEIDVTEPLRKIDNAIAIISEEKISVVLVGAFSDGKTSVAAGWLNEKMSDMKIDSDESSDEILCYTPSSIPDGCQIVDTPGLFGDKIGADENGAKIALSDITRKYISEANLILYVVTAKNPIKDSHKECIHWILKDLNKLTSTIFVINRMDDVADLTDDDDFNNQAKIKSDTLRGKLLECGMSPAEAAQSLVACISAAPNGKSIEKWSEYREQYLRRSHLDALEKLINEVLRNTKDDLIIKTGCDILNDEIKKLLDAIQNQQEQIRDCLLPEKKESLKRNTKDLEALRKKILRSKQDMKKELSNLKKKKISAIRAATAENFKDVMEDEIGIVSGKEGHVLNSQINDIFSEYAETFSSWAIELGNKFQAEYEKQNEAVSSLLKSGTRGVANGLKGARFVDVNTFKAAIFAGRDLLKKMGVVIKFKPWQVTKMATFATKALPVIGAAIDITTVVFENVTADRRNREFQKSKDDVKDAISSVFLDVEELLDVEDRFIDQFAPQYRILEQQLAQDDNDIQEQEKLLNQYQLWCNSLYSSQTSIL